MVFLKKIKNCKPGWKFWGVLSALVFVLLFLVIFNYETSLKLKTGAQNAVTSAIGDVYTYTDNFNYSDKGILIYTYADGPYGNMNATFGGLAADEKEITYTIVVTNPHREVHNIRLKFDIPSGFVYKSLVSGQTPTSTANPITWNTYSALAGESRVSFKIGK